MLPIQQHYLTGFEKISFPLTLLTELFQLHLSKLDDVLMEGQLGKFKEH